MLNYYTSEQGKKLEKRVENVEQGGGGGSDYVELATLIADDDGFISFEYDTPIDVTSMVVFHDLDRDANHILGVKAVTSHSPDSTDSKSLRPGIFGFMSMSDGSFAGFHPSFSLPEELENDDAEEYVWLDINKIESDDRYYLCLEIDNSNYKYSAGDRIKVYAKLTDKYNAIQLSRSNL